MSAKPIDMKVYKGDRHLNLTATFTSAVLIASTNVEHNDLTHDPHLPVSLDSYLMIGLFATVVPHRLATDTRQCQHSIRVSGRLLLQYDLAIRIRQRLLLESPEK